MTDQNTAAKTEANTAERKPWPQRFGTLESLQVKNGQRGRYGIAVIDCKAFKQTAFVFNEMALEKLIAAGEGAQVWTKGPIEAAQRKNAEGKTYSEDVYKVVYAKDITKSDDEAGEAPAAAEDDAPVSEATAAEAESSDLDDEIPF